MAETPAICAVPRLANWQVLSPATCEEVTAPNCAAVTEPKALALMEPIWVLVSDPQPWWTARQHPRCSVPRWSWSRATRPARWSRRRADRCRGCRSPRTTACWSGH